MMKKKNSLKIYFPNYLYYMLGATKVKKRNIQPIFVNFQNQNTSKWPRRACD